MAENEIIKIINYVDCEICYNFNDPTCDDSNIQPCNIDLSENNRINYISHNGTCPCQSNYYEGGEINCELCHYSWFKIFSLIILV